MTGLKSAAKRITFLESTKILECSYHTRLLIWVDSSAFMASLRNARTSVPDAVQRTLSEVADACLAVAKQNCPVDKGELVASGSVQQVGDGFEVVFSAPHAAAVHERTDLQHNTGGPKFLERAFLAAALDLNKKIADSIGDSLGKLA